MSKHGPKKLTKELFERNKSIIEQTLESFAGRKRAVSAATRAITDNVLSAQTKVILRQLVKGNEDVYYKRFGFNPYLTEAIGTSGRYGMLFASTLVHLADVDGIPLEDLNLAAFYIIDRAMPSHHRTKSTMSLPDREVPLKFASSKYAFRKKVLKVLKILAAGNHIEFNERRGVVYRSEVDPVGLMTYFWGRMLHRNTASFKRAMNTTLINFRNLSLPEVFPEMANYHLGREYNIKRADIVKWFALMGPDGAGLLFTDKLSKLHLQYHKARFRGIGDIGDEIKAVTDVNTAIKFMPWVTKNQLEELFQHDLKVSMKLWYAHKELSPVKLEDAYSSRGLADQLGWGYSKEPLGLEQHNARPVIGELWKYIKPKITGPTGERDFSEVEDASNTLIAMLYDLKKGEMFKTSTRIEKRAAEGLVVLGYAEKVPGGIVVKKGMEDATSFLALYTSGM